MDSKELFEKAKKTSHPVVVDFWAPWCGPCRVTKPILDKLAKEYKGEVEFWPINADEQPDLLRELKIFGIPTVIAIQGGKLVSRVTGAQPEDNYRNLFAALAKGEKLTLPISFLDRFIRLSIGAAVITMAFQTQTWWAVPLGVIVLFTGLYDRIPIWKNITDYFNKKTP